MIFPIRRAAAAALTLTLTLSLAAPGSAQTVSGSYLAGRQAVFSSDFAAAAEYYGRALGYDPDNTELMENVALSHVALGRVDRALPMAQRLEDLGLHNQIAHMVVVADLFVRGDFQAVLAREADTLGVGPLVDGLIAAWALMGDGSVSQALKQFDTLADEKGLRSFALYHKAMALASVGDFEGAEALFAGPDGEQSVISRRAVLARAEILSQLDRNSEALEMLAEAFGAAVDPGVTAMADRLASGEKLPFSHVRSARDGAAEVFYSIGAVLSGDSPDHYTLLYSRIAGYLDPGHIDALILSAGLLENLGQFDLSVAAYRQVPQDHPDRYAAELGRAEALRQAAKPDAAIEVLDRLAQDHPTLPQVHSSLGDLLRQEEKYALAARAYDKALQYTEEGAPNQWFTLYARGICHERLKDWDKAEADFRKALDLNPDQPQVLNYLGYSLVEKRMKLDEALGMIERAVAARPDSGYIVDSLGWVLFRLGRYGEAVGHMEKAVELMPVDAVVNDHLGDVYWAVGRKREAEFQWRRALSFIDTSDADSEADPDRIRSKLEIGLDAVLVREGADPLKVANGQGG